MKTLIGDIIFVAKIVVLLILLDLLEDDAD